MIALLYSSVILAADPHVAEAELTLSVNSATICQYDHVVVKAVVANHGDGGLVLKGEPNSAGDYIRYEMKKGKEWQRVVAMAGRGYFCGVTATPILVSGATYAEYDSIHLKNHDISFVFEKPGTYLLRAVLGTSAGQLCSQPVEVVVQSRPAHDSRRIEEAKWFIGMLGVGSNGLPLPQELVALKDVGGNVGRAVEQKLFLHRIRSGQQPLEGDNVVKTLRKSMDGIDLEVGVHVLGTHYTQQLDWKHLQQLLDAIPDPTDESRHWEHNLELHRLPEFVPKRPEPKEE